MSLMQDTAVTAKKFLVFRYKNQGEPMWTKPQTGNMANNRNSAAAKVEACWGYTMPSAGHTLSSS